MAKLKLTDHLIVAFAFRLQPDQLLLQELEALKGWKYCLSFLLELADILFPVARSCMARVSSAVSWLLVKLIGRALGLVYKGVKQSLVPQSSPKKPREGSKGKSDRDSESDWLPSFA